MRRRNRKRLFERFDNLQFDSERRFPRRSTENHNVLGLHRNSGFETRRHTSLYLSLGTDAPEQFFRLRLRIRRRNVGIRSSGRKRRDVQDRRMNRRSRVLPASYRRASRSGRRFRHHHYQRRNPKHFRLSRLHDFCRSGMNRGERLPFRIRMTARSRISRESGRNVRLNPRRRQSLARRSQYMSLRENRRSEKRDCHDQFRLHFRHSSRNRHRNFGHERSLHGYGHGD